MNKSQWISVKERLPEAETDVLAFFINEYGKQRIVRAFYAPRFTVEDGYDNEYEASEYDDKKDTYYLKEGWYEHNEHEEINWFIYNVTNWMELPEPPI